MVATDDWIQLRTNVLLYHTLLPNDVCIAQLGSAQNSILVLCHISHRVAFTTLEAQKSRCIII